MTVSEDLQDFTLCYWSLATVARLQAEVLRQHVASAHPGGALVETCQRMEAYAARSDCTCVPDRRLSGFEAVLHLATVASGLDSAVLGEAQILGQVRAGVSALRGANALVVDVAIAAARQLRSEAGFDATTGHLLDHALPLAGIPARGTVLVLGVGVAGTAVARRARTLGFDRIAVASRREPVDPGAYGGDHWLPLGEVSGAGPFDVTVSCLGPSAPELTHDDLPRARGYIDLGSPPNLAANVRPVVRLADIVGAQTSDPVEAGRREQLHSRLREILEGRLAMARERSDTPLGRIRREVEAVRQREVARIARLHPELSPQAIENLTRGLVNQIFHIPSERLRAIDDAELGERFADLFSAAEGTQS